MLCDFYKLHITFFSILLLLLSTAVLLCCLYRSSSPLSTGSSISWSCLPFSRCSLTIAALRCGGNTWILRLRTIKFIDLKIQKVIHQHFVSLLALCGQGIEVNKGASCKWLDCVDNYGGCSLSGRAFNLKRATRKWEWGSSSEVCTRDKAAKSNKC